MELDVVYDSTKFPHGASTYLSFNDSILGFVAPSFLSMMTYDGIAYFYVFNQYFRHILLPVTTTDNPLYTDSRYNDKIRYNDNLTVMKASLKR